MISQRARPSWQPGSPPTVGPAARGRGKYFVLCALLTLYEREREHTKHVWICGIVLVCDKFRHPCFDFRNVTEQNKYIKETVPFRWPKKRSLGIKYFFFPPLKTFI